MKPDDIMYGLEDQEQLCDSVEEVVQRVFERTFQPGDQSDEAIADRIEWPIKVHEHRRMDVTGLRDALIDRALSQALETIDEEHSDPDGDSTEPTPEMTKAAEAFIDVVLSQYVSWACEPTGKVIEVTREEGMQMV